MIVLSYLLITSNLKIVKIIPVKGISSSVSLSEGLDFGMIPPDGIFEHFDQTFTFYKVLFGPRFYFVVQ